MDTILKNNPEAFNKSDLLIMKNLSQMPAPDKHLIQQQGAYESLHRDTVVSFSTWEFDPLVLDDPFPDGTGTVHLWMGSEDGFVAGELLHHVCQRLPWIQRHEVPHGGHLFIHDKNLCEMILRSLVLTEIPCFESF